MLWTPAFAGVTGSLLSQRTEITWCHPRS